MLGIRPSTFYRWYDRYQAGGVEALEDKPSQPIAVWNRIPDEVRERIVAHGAGGARAVTPRAGQHASPTQKYFVSESSVYRLLKAHDLITSPAFVVIKAADEFGVWRLVSAQVRMEDNGESIDVHGPNPLGFAMFEPGGRAMFIITHSGREAPANDAESAALYRGMTAYAGDYQVEQGEVVTKVDVAWHPAWENTEQRRFFELSGDTLKLSTAVQEHPSHPGRLHRGILTWARAP